MSDYTPNPALLFASPPATNGELVFGAIAESGAAVEATLSVQLPGLAVSARVALSATAALAVALPGLEMASTVSYDSNVQRPLVAEHRSAWQVADRAAQAPVSTPMQPVVRRHAATAAAWQSAGHLRGAPVSVPLQPVVRRHGAVASRWQDAQSRPGAAAAATWSDCDHSNRPVAASRWQEAQGMPGQQAASGWQECDHSVRPVRRSHWRVAQPLHAPRSTRMGPARRLHAQRVSWWQEARRPPAGRSSWGTVTPPADPCYLPDPALVFWDTTHGPALVFVCDRHPDAPPATVVVPVRRIYMQINDVSLVRVDGALPIVCPSLQLSIDVDSWTWGWSASVPGAELAKLEPAAVGEPVELLASLNGTAFRLMAESISRDRSYASSTLRVSGRGRAAMLDAPYAAETTFGAASAYTAQQLALQALEINGVPSGWSIDWGPEDWSVPAGVWSHQGTPISALNRIAEAAGAYVQAHPSEDRLLVLPRYPVAPWAWATATPDIELPSAPVTKESIAWAEKAVYNRVFVSGASAGGILAQITRAGTAGDSLASMVTDPLCTDIIAGRQRALPVLADVGRQATVGLRLPVLTETGVIRTGKLVRYVDGTTTRLGLVRSVSVEATRPSLRETSVWQTIEVQTYA